MQRHLVRDRYLRLTLIILLGLCMVFAASPALAIGQTPNTPQISLVGFSLTVTPDTLNIQNGSSANDAITVTSQGLDGPVNLRASTSPNSGLQAVTDPSNVLVLPGGNAVSTLEVNATAAQIGDYKINVTGSSTLTLSQSFIVTAHVSGPPSQPSTSPQSGSPTPGTSSPNNQQPSTTTSPNPKGRSTPQGPGSQSILDPVGVIVAGNLLAAIGTIGTIVSMYRKRGNMSRASS